MNEVLLEQYGDAEHTLLAALMFHDRLVSRHIARIDVGLFFGVEARDLAARTLMQYQIDGGPCTGKLVDQINDQVSNDSQRARLLRCVLDLACTANYLVAGGVDWAIERLIDRRRDHDFECQFESLQNQMAGGKMQPARAAEVMTEIAGRFEDSPLSKTLRMSDLMDTDPADEVPDTVPTGLRWFDDAMAAGAIERGDKMVVSAPPGAGKTALALQLTLSMLESNVQKSALWAMGEMTPKHLRNRSLQCLSGMGIGLLKRSYEQLDKRQGDVKRQAVEHLRDIGNRLHFLQSPLTPATIEQQIIASGACWCVVDYLQLCRGDRATDSRLEELDGIVAALTRIAQIHRCVLILISDMPKGGMNKRDIFDAFKGTSEIGFMADLAYTGEVIGDEKDAQEVTVEWRCLKNRHGSQKDLHTRFDRNTQRFHEYGGAR
ncbi:MAG: DnaB-like helicase C-terminal domain-containing protein [Phycisphaerales bacterium]|nr:DnaB-like helicase C-terminal domain-containing protein [Phycisphaerales bacterium]